MSYIPLGKSSLISQNLRNFPEDVNSRALLVFFLSIPYLLFPPISSTQPSSAHLLLLSLVLLGTLSTASPCTLHLCLDLWLHKCGQDESILTVVLSFFGLPIHDCMFLLTRKFRLLRHRWESDCCLQESSWSFCLLLQQWLIYLWPFQRVPQ